MAGQDTVLRNLAPVTYVLTCASNVPTLYQLPATRHHSNAACGSLSELLLKNSRDFHLRAQQADLERSVPMDGYDNPLRPAFFDENVVTPLDASQHPAFALNGLRKRFAGYLLQIASSKTRLSSAGTAAVSPASNQSSTASRRLARISSSVSPWVTQPGSAGTSAQNPPSSAWWTIALSVMDEEYFRNKTAASDGNPGPALRSFCASVIARVPYALCRKPYASYRNTVLPSYRTTLYPPSQVFSPATSHPRLATAPSPHAVCDLPTFPPSYRTALRSAALYARPESESCGRKVSIETEHVAQAGPFHQDEGQAVGKRNRLVSKFFHQPERIEQILTFCGQPLDADRHHVLAPLCRPRVRCPPRQ